MNKYLFTLIPIILILFCCQSKPEKKQQDSIVGITSKQPNNEINRIESRAGSKKIKKSKKKAQKKKPTNSPSRVKAPDFVLSDLDGNIVELAAFSGQVIMLNFWGTWCGPCRQEIPDFIDLYKEFNSDGLEIIGVTLQSGPPESIKKFKDAWGINYPILTDINRYETYKAFSDYGNITGVGTRGVPTTFIIDREGYIVKSYIGPRPGAVFYRDFKPYL